MNDTLRSLFPMTSIAVLTAAAALSGCGAGAGGAGSDAPPSDASLYAATVDYCGIDEPSGKEAAEGAWQMSYPSFRHTAAGSYDVSATISVGGATPTTEMMDNIFVEPHDYRGVSGNFVPVGIANPQQKMGVVLVPLLSPKSAGCVMNLSKIRGSASGYSTLNWSSKWSPSVSFAGIAGSVVDGFEFVANFVPASSSVYFVVPKTWFATGAGLSICYQAPSASNWDCAAAKVTDTAPNWTLERPSARSGAYVLVGPARN
jgi:hypothetical protein